MMHQFQRPGANDRVFILTDEDDKIDESEGKEIQPPKE